MFSSVFKLREVWSHDARLDDAISRPTAALAAPMVGGLSLLPPMRQRAPPTRQTLTLPPGSVLPAGSDHLSPPMSPRLQAIWQLSPRLKALGGVRSPSSIERAPSSHH